MFDFLQTPLGIIFITIISGTIGGTVSYFLQRRSQYKTWLIESRTNAFIEFIKEFERCRSKASEFLRNPISARINDDGLILNIFELYEPMISHSRVIRLLLDEKYREGFDSYIKIHTKIHCTAIPENVDAAREEMIALRNHIQKILELHLNKNVF